MSFISIPFTFFKSFISKGHSRSVNAKKNILFSFLVRAGSIATSLIVLPLTIDYLNPTQYGIWITLTSVISWFSFFDIGLGNGLRNKFTEAVAKDDHEMARIYVSTTYAILCVIMLVVLFVFLCVNPFLNWSEILNTSPAMTGELRVLALITFVFFCLQFVLQLITTIFTANQQPAKAYFYNFLGSLFALIIIVVLVKTTEGNLLYLGAAFSFAPAFALVIASILAFRGRYSRYAPSIKHVRFRYAKNLMTLGIKFFVIQIAFVVFYQTNNIIIAQLFGPAQVTPYNIAFKYFSIVPMLFGIVLLPFWSAFTDAWSKNDTVWIRTAMKKLQWMWVLVLSAAVAMFAFSSIVYRIWIGSEVFVSVSISAVMALYVVVNAWNSIYSNFLNGVGKIKLQLYTALFGSLVNIPLAIFLGKSLGIYGVILSTTIVSLVPAVLLPIQYKKIINSRTQGIWAE